METLAELFRTLDWLEVIGFSSGLLCVWLLVRQNIWTWPLGLVYAIVSIPVLYARGLVGQSVLHVVFLAFNAYGWWYWTVGGRGEDDGVPVTRADPRLLGLLVAVALACAILPAQQAAIGTPPLIAFLDGSVLTLTLVAMWLSTRKKIENWLLWFVIDVVATGVFLYSGLYFYALLYLIYLGLAIEGFREWRRDLDDGVAGDAEAS